MLVLETPQLWHRIMLNVFATKVEKKRLSVH